MICKSCGAVISCTICGKRRGQNMVQGSMRLPKYLCDELDNFAKKHGISRNVAVYSLLKHLLIDSEVCSADCKCTD